MKIQLLFAITLFLSFFSIGAEKDTIPKDVAKSIPSLAHYLTADLNSEREKVESIYTWITHNIAYDYKKLESNKMIIGVDPANTLKSKKAICSGYVELMRAMLQAIDVDCETVPGYVKNSHWIKGDSLFEESHVWMAIKIGSDWFLADPTWDAGYIGRIPKKDFKERFYFQKSFKWEARKTRVLDRREKRKERRYQAWKEKDDYTNKTGFVKNPGQEFFLVHPDTFLLSHLPTNPIWQLRDQKVSLMQFSSSNEELIETMGEMQNSISYNTSEIGIFMGKDFLEQLISNGEDGQKFNPYNPGIKLLNYYNFLSLITRKDLQEVARGTVYAITPSKYPELLAKTDTVSEYLRAYKKFEKSYYKKNREIDKNNFKKEESNNKILFKNAEKLKDEHEKLIETFKKNSEKLNDQTEKYNAMRLKIAEKYPKAIDYEVMDSFDSTVVMPWIDSINYMRTEMYNLMDLFNLLRENTCMKSYVYNLNYINKLMDVNKSLIPYNNYSTSATILEIDSLAIARSQHMLNIIDDSIVLELLDREIYAYVKQIEFYTKKAKLEFRELKAQNEIKYPFRYEIFLNAMLYQDLISVIEYNSSSENFNANILNALNHYKGLTQDFLSAVDKQENLKTKKYEHNKKLTEKDHERTLDMIEHIEKNLIKWEEKYSDKD